MTVDFKAIKASAKSKRDSQGICGIAIGPSGSGKSSLIGSFPGSVLHLYTSDEGHALQSASIHGGDVVGYCIDRTDDGKVRDADEALNTLVSILRDPAIPDNFSAVGLDSLSSVDLLIKKTAWYDEFLRGANGKKNDFKSSEAVVTKIQEIFAATEGFRAKGVHFLATLAALVKAETNGEAEVVSPVLSSFGAAEALPRMAGVVLYVGKTDVDGEMKRALLFNVRVKRDSKDIRGSIQKMLSFNPRIAGVPDDDIPVAMPPHMGKLLEFIKSVKGG
jgi:GTPase SAR1 family protein